MHCRRHGAETLQETEPTAQRTRLWGRGPAMEAEDVGNQFIGLFVALQTGALLEPWGAPGCLSVARVPAAEPL